MTPAALLSLWLELGGGVAGADGLDRRRLDTTSAVDLFACIFWPSRRPGLLIEGDGEQRPIDNQIPRCRGVRVVHEIVAGVSGVRTRLLIVLEDERLLDIFAILSADLINVVRAEPAAASALRRCIDRLSMWQGLFERVPTEGMSDESQRGLFGELVVLEDFCLTTLDPLEGVNAWVGPMGAHQDFTHNGLAVEVKTTLAKRHARIMIANEKQLDERPHQTLLLAHVRIDESVAHGMTLPVLVGRIRQVLTRDQSASREFEERLMNAGYLDLHALLYERHCWRVSGIRFFEVAGRFPRLTESNLPSGVGDIRYSIIADDLTAHEITASLATGMLEGANERS